MVVTEEAKRCHSLIIQTYTIHPAPPYGNKEEENLLLMNRERMFKSKKIKI